MTLANARMRNKMKLLIIEKPSMLRCLRDHITIDESVDIVYTYGFGLWHYKIPKIKFEQIPYSDKPSEYSPRSTNTEYCHRYMHNGNNEDLVVTNKNDLKEDVIRNLELLIETIKSRLPYYDEIILMPDADQTGAWSVKQIIDQLPEDELPPINALLLNLGLDSKSIKFAIDNREEHAYGKESFVDNFADKHKVKKYFDFWWYANSKMVFSEICKWAGLKSNVLMSKYEFMLISIIANQKKPLPKFEMFRLMEMWPGTGKYSSKEYWGQIGSAASRNSIIDNAIERGAIEKITVSNSEVCVLSERGRAFLSRVHKKTFDPDLAFRLEDWCNKKDIKSAQRYISTLFRRQFRYQRKLLKCSCITNELIQHFTRVHNLSAIIKNDPNSDEIKDEFYLRTVDHQNAGLVSVEPMQCGFFKVILTTKDDVYADIVKDIKCSEQGILTPSGWVRKYGTNGISNKSLFEEMPF